ncbi:MAG: hypothetical protein LBJ76_01640 [Candidatus Accumulibacter sp.]|nr:hypothetical protein [Accumulibacter sp.]
MSLRFPFLAIVVLVTAFLCACGKRGSLFLPPPSRNETQPVSSPPAAARENPDPEKESAR